MAEATKAGARSRLMPDQTNRLFLSRVPVPPIAHAYHHWDAENSSLVYTYNGRRIVSIHMPGAAAGHYRHGSDGSIQSFPFFQQIYVMLEGKATATVTFTMSADAVNMRPGRAGGEQAILGQVGRPLLPDVNGLYDLEQDMMVGWHGRPWRWIDSELTPDADGNLTASMEVELDAETWVITLKPQYYRTHLGYQYHRPWEWRPDERAVAGWCTWEAYRREVTEADVTQASDFLAKRLRPYGLEYVQVDDGFQNLPVPCYPDRPVADGWLDTKPEFPSGHEGLVKGICGRGFEPGVWTTSGLNSDDFADTQPECLVKDENGDVLIGDWVKYILDCTPETLARHVRGYYRGLREKGYTYFKTDGIRHLIYDGLQEAVLRGLMTNEDAEARFRAYLQAARDEIGDAYFLSSWGVLTQGVGLVDACRIAQDANPTWAGMQMQLVETARWFFTHRVLWTNDPDHVCVRGSFEWSRTTLSLVSLTGGLYMLSDPIAKYDDERVRLCQQTLPPLTTRTAETGPLDIDYAAFAWTKLHSFAVTKDKKDMRRSFGSEPEHEREPYDMVGRWKTAGDAHPFSTLYAVHLNTPAARWCVMGRFASLPLKASNVALNALSLPADREYVAFDFWAQKYLGRVTESLACPALPLGHCQIVALRERLDRPQLLSSSRHVSQDAVSVKGETWSDGALSLKLIGVSGTKETYWLHVPAGFEGATATSKTLLAAIGAAQADSSGDGALPVEVEFPAATTDCVEGEVTIRWR